MSWAIEGPLTVYLHPGIGLVSPRELFHHKITTLEKYKNHRKAMFGGFRDLEMTEIVCVLNCPI